MANKLTKHQLKKLIILTIIILVILIIILVIVKTTTPKEGNRSYDKVNAVVNENKEKATLDKLQNMNEQERMSFYCGQFFRLIDTHKYAKAYELLYDKYKEDYFPTYESFEKYCKDYFPDDMALNYKNIERLGDIYVMWIYVNDTLNGSKLGHNFDMYVVLQENDYNDYVMSFSRDSAVKTMKGDE